MNLKYSLINLFTCNSSEPDQRAAAELLQNFIDMTNETVGDAISDVFLLETVLCARGLSAEAWRLAYRDLPCRQLKVTVQVRTRWNGL